MDLYIKIIKGPRTGDVFKLSADITLGRSKASVNIKDPKASSLHGKVEKDGDHFFYVDLKSTNGSFHQGTRISRLHLSPGVVFSIGATEIEVVTEFELKKISDVNLSDWREALFNFNGTLASDQNEFPLKALPNLVSVKISRGVDAGKEWLLGYGPRALGPNNPDLYLLIPGEKETLLLLKEALTGLSLHALVQDKVLFNGLKMDSIPIGDEVKVQINETLLEFRLINETD